MSAVQFQILIPSCGEADAVGRTVESIRRQRYNREDIFTNIVDFGPTDEAYREMLRLDPFHLGVYRADEDVAEDQRPAEAARLVAYTDPDSPVGSIGEAGSQILLWPGDVLYPDSLDRVARIIKERRHTGMIISEADVQARDGVVTRRPLLYETERVIDGKTGYMEYLGKGYRHNVLSFGGMIHWRRHYEFGQANERIWWNKSFFVNFGRDALYIPEYLGCVRERCYQDEMQEILFRWDSILLLNRCYEGRYGAKLQSSGQAEENLVRYTLWRSWLLAEKDDWQQAEECFRFSTILFPDIRKTQIYRWLETYVLKKDRSACPSIQAYFEENE